MQQHEFEAWVLEQQLTAIVENCAVINRQTMPLEPDVEEFIIRVNFKGRQLRYSYRVHRAILYQTHVDVSIHVHEMLKRNLLAMLLQELGVKPDRRGCGLDAKGVYEVLTKERY